MILSKNNDVQNKNNVLLLVLEYGFWTFELNKTWQTRFSCCSNVPKWRRPFPFRTVLFYAQRNYYILVERPGVDYELHVALFYWLILSPRFLKAEVTLFLPSKSMTYIMLKTLESSSFDFSRWPMPMGWEIRFVLYEKLRRFLS